MKVIQLITAATLASSLLVACKKNTTGGKATIAALPQHHGVTIYGATAYVKFNAKELPANPTTNYDLKIVGGKKEDHIHIEGLRYGNYYVYVTGYDSAIAQVVTGGIPAKIKYSQRSKELDMVVPVKE